MSRLRMKVIPEKQSTMNKSRTNYFALRSVIAIFYYVTSLTCFGISKEDIISPRFRQSVNGNYCI